MTPYLHTSRNLHLIAGAAKIDDVDAALRHVMEPNGITTGDVAGVMFADFDWNNATVDQREQQLRLWLRTEQQMKED